MQIGTVIKIISYIIAFIIGIVISKMIDMHHDDIEYYDTEGELHKENP